MQNVLRAILFLFSITILPLSAGAKSFSVLIVASFAAKYKGLTGVEGYVSNHARVLRAAGFPVHVLVEEKSGLHRRLAAEGVSLETYSFGKLFKGHGRKEFARFLRSLVTTHKITHVHCNLLGELKPVYEALRGLAVPIFCSHHYQESFPVSQYPFVAGFAVVNKHLEQGLMAKQRGLKKVPVVFIPPFLHEERFLSFVPPQEPVLPIDRNDGLPVITMIGNFYNNPHLKNYPLLISATELLVRDYHYPCRIIIVGDGANAAQIKQMVAAKRLEKYVHFLGFREDVPAIIHESDVVVLTSKSEGFGMALAEANLMGKPVIGPAGTGVEGVITDKVNGLLFATDDVHDFCRKIITLTRDKKAMHAMGKRAQVYALEHFTTEPILQRFYSFYGLRSGLA